MVYLPECHESLAGIIAGRIREQYHKPTMILTKAEEGVKGSGRSIEAYHMFKALLEVKELLTKFGGHPMAAGFSMPEEHVEQFRKELNKNANLTPEDFIPQLWIDVAMPMEYVSEPLIHELELLEPFGQGNEKPQFAQKGIHIRNVKVLGRKWIEGKRRKNSQSGKRTSHGAVYAYIGTCDGVSLSLSCILFVGGSPYTR